MPPHWSKDDWFEEMGAEVAAAALQAECDFDPVRGVPLSAFVYQRVIASALARYRREWGYAVRCISQHGEEGYGGRVDDSICLPEVHELLLCALARLSPTDRWLVEQLFWEGKTEAEVAEALGISHQAVSKRKRAVLQELRVWLETSKLI